MNILFLTQLLPYPISHGGKLKTFNLIKTLSQKHKIYLGCFVAKKEDLKHASYFKKYCQQVKAIVWPYVNARYKKIPLKIFSLLFSARPVIVSLYDNQEMGQYIENVFEKEKIDIFYIENLSMCQYLKYLPQAKNLVLVYGEHNIAWLSRKRLFNIEKNLIKKAFFLIDTIKLYFYEKKIIPRFNCWLAISELDKIKLGKMGAKAKNTFFLPTLIKTKSLFKALKRKKPNILFIGLLSWDPNRDAFYWFYKEIFPLIVKKMPSVSFWAVGDEPEEKMRLMAKQNKGLKITGFIKDLKAVFAQASVFVAPIRTGSGLRIKILTAMAAGLPIVSTTLGVEGLKVKDKKEFLLADKPNEFANQVVKIIQEINLAKRLSKNGQDFIKKNYNLKNYKRTLRKVFKEV